MPNRARTDDPSDLSSSVIRPAGRGLAAMTNTHKSVTTHRPVGEILRDLRALIQELRLASHQAPATERELPAYLRVIDGGRED